MGSSSVVLWWEEWQLRILVLGSLLLQYFLAFAAVHRRRSIPSSLRFLIWLAYLGSDALAIYALATLFSRQKKTGLDSNPVLATRLNLEGKAGGDGSGVLEVFWAPILLLHLAGPDSITAYNIEDNELWRRHVLTVISQVTVSLYVFCKSWSGENKLLTAAVLLFIAGTLKCIDKPMALKSASIYGLVTSSPFHDQKSQPNDQAGKKSLEAYIQEAKGYFSTLNFNDVYAELVVAAMNKDLRVMPFWLFVDLASTLCHRLRVLRFFLILDNENADSLLQTSLCGSFVRLYTKKSMLLSYFWVKDKTNGLISTYAHLNRLLAVCLTISAVALFHQSHKQGYNNSDIKVTYTLLWCTAGLEVYALVGPKYKFFTWCNNVAQYNLIAFFARDQKPTKLLKLARCFRCKDYVDQHWYAKQCSSSFAITELVIEHVKAGWKDYIQDTSTYWTFNDRRGQVTIEHEGCEEELCRTLDVPFDECVIVWHIATDICFYEGVPAAGHQLKAATRCREISNYMLYLLVVNPDMLMSGTRAGILSNTCKELGSMLKDAKGAPSDEGDLTREIHRKAQGLRGTAATEKLIPRASGLASELLAMDGDRRWRVMQGVWVEMMCFSASRCRGYLHAKSLGQGGEYLSYVWLLLWYMGLESVAERQQRSDFRSSYIERTAIPPPPRTEAESCQELEIQQEEGAVRSDVEDEEAETVILEIQEDDEATAAAHASQATVARDNTA